MKKWWLFSLAVLLAAGVSFAEMAGRVAWIASIQGAVSFLAAGADASPGARRSSIVHW